MNVLILNAIELFTVKWLIKKLKVKKMDLKDIYSPLFSKEIVPGTQK